MPEPIKPNPPPSGTQTVSGNGQPVPNGSVPAGSGTGPETFALNAPGSAPKTSVLESLLAKSGVKPAQAHAPTQSLGSLLGPKPIVTRAILEEKQRSRTKIAKAVFQLAVIIALGAYGYFKNELDPNFTFINDKLNLGLNTAQRFEASNAELKKVKTEENLLQYRTARLWLDEINNLIDPFHQQVAILKSDFSTSLEKQNAEAEFQILGAEIKTALIAVQKIFREPVGIELYSATPRSAEEIETEYEDLLRKGLTEQRQKLASDAKHREELRTYDNIIRLIGNKNFRNFVKTQNIEKISEEKFDELLTKIREEGADELSSVDKVRKKRLDWGRVIQDIHAVARKADPLYGQGLFKSIGGFLFTSYQFDAGENKISISGQTKTSDSKTFSFIAQLVDAVEKSTKFREIDFRSFAKNREASGEYSSSVNLDFEIQTEPDPRDDIPLSEEPPEAGPVIGEPD